MSVNSAPAASTPSDPTEAGPVTFVLPGDGRSGGVRVTVLMANLLRVRGYHARIVCPFPRLSWRGRVAQLLSWAHGRAKTGFLHEFKGLVEYYHSLDDLDYRPGEIVIAVGTYTVADVRALTKPVIKIRFNHGFPAQPNAVQEQAWRGTMPTITVSNTLVARLEELSGEKVVAVVPNGIDTSLYFPEPGVVRDGIGAVFNSHPNKAPEDMLALLAQIHRRWPALRQRVFSTERAPKGMRHVEFTRLPSAAEARAIYSRCQIWLLTSRTEGLPGVVLEAVACGCVVISTDNVGSLEILRHGENGVIVPRGDLPGFMSEIGRLLTDDALTRRLSAGALKTAESFTWEQAADRMEQALQSIYRSARTAETASV